MFYRNICVAFALGMLFMIGIGSREKLVPNQLVEPLRKSLANASSAAKAAAAVAAAATTTPATTAATTATARNP